MAGRVAKCAKSGTAQSRNSGEVYMLRFSKGLDSCFEGRGRLDGGGVADYHPPHGNKSITIEERALEQTPVDLRNSWFQF